MKDIAILTEKRYLKRCGNNIYIDNILKEDGLVQLELEKLGICCDRVAWDNNFNPHDFKLALFRTTWNYFDQLELFNSFLKSCQNQTTLINGYDQIVWNLNKKYLIELGLGGINIPETKLIKRGGLINFIKTCKDRGWKEVVIKPCVSAAAWNTHYIKTINHHSKEVFDRLVRDHDMLIQVFQKSIVRFGEISLMMINGEYSHAVLKNAKPGDFRVQDDFGGTVSLYSPKDVEIKFAKSVMSRVPFDAVYARVDVVIDNNNKLALSELELIEPEMWFRLKPGSAKNLAKTIFGKYFS